VHKSQYQPFQGCKNGTKVDDFNHQKSQNLSRIGMIALKRRYVAQIERADPNTDKKIELSGSKVLLIGYIFQVT
jgi:hypothetical protein